MTIRLADFAAPLEPVQFPNGHTYDVRPFSEAEYKLLERHQLHGVMDQLKNGGSFEAEVAAAANTKRLKRDATRAPLSATGARASSSRS